MIQIDRPHSFADIIFHRMMTRIKFIFFYAVGQFA